jgi:thiol-disulfide isomerase/thioredoxin
MDVRKVGDHECINCGECIPVCPTKAIYYNGSKFKLNNTNEEVKVEVETNNEIKKDNKKTLKLLSQVGASVLLVGVLIYGYFGDQKAPVSDPNKAEIGKECKDFEFTVSYKDNMETYKLSEHKGKITILNFWNINCSSCIAEIPHFEEFYDNYKDDVNVIFINPTDGKVKNDEFMFDNEWDTYDATFTTIDNETSQITSYFPIGTTFPHTVILDRNNIVREMVTAAMSYESLETYYNFKCLSRQHMLAGVGIFYKKNIIYNESKCTRYTKS